MAREWTQLPAVLGAEGQARVYRTNTVFELAEALADADRTRADMTFIQAVVPRLDVPELLADLARAATSANQRTA